MTNSKDKKKDLTKEINIHFIKTSSYRSYHVDGAYGGLTPKGDIYCEFFIDRNVTPQTIVHEIEEDGRLGDSKKVIGKDGFVRQIECGIVFDVNTANALKNWLEDKIKEFEKKKKLLKREE